MCDKNSLSRSISSPSALGFTGIIVNEKLLEFMLFAFELLGYISVIRNKLQVQTADISSYKGVCESIQPK